MKKIYYVECNWDTNQGEDFGFWANEKAMATFTTRKEAHKWLVARYRYLKELCRDELKRLGKLGETITLDLYKFAVDNDFDIEVDNPWEQDDNYSMVDSRYLCGRY